MNGEVVTQSPLKDCIQSPLKDLDAGDRLLPFPGSGFPRYAVVIGSHARWGLCGFNPANYHSAATGQTAYNDANALARNWTSPGNTIGLPASEACSAHTPGQISEKINRYMQMSWYHEGTNIIDPIAQTTQQVSEQGTLKIDRLTGVIYDATVTWSAMTYGGSDIPGGSIHMWLDDNSIYQQSGSDPADYWMFHGGMVLATWDWYNLGTSWAADDSSTTITVRDDYAGWSASGHAHYLDTRPEHLDEPINIAISETWWTQLSDVFSAADAKAIALSLMDRVPYIGTNYGLWDDGTQTTYSALLTWNCVWYVSYENSLPARVHIRAGDPSPGDVWATKEFYTLGNAVVCSRLWAYKDDAAHANWSYEQYALPDIDASISGGPTGSIHTETINTNFWIRSAHDMVYDWARGNAPTWY